jgi:hypothetical protein
MLPFVESFSNIIDALRRHRRAHGRLPNLLYPTTFNEHVVYKKLFDRNPLLVQLADKYAVRDYVAARVGPAYLKQLYWVTDDPTTIDWESLPQSFVVKATHGCRFNLFVDDKTKLDHAAVVARCQTWLAQNYYWRGREWCYKAIPPRIMVEEFLSSDALMQIPDDYQFFCFGGVPTYIQIYRRGNPQEQRGGTVPGAIQGSLDRVGPWYTNLYDTAWNRLPVKTTLENYEGDLAPPPTLEEMFSVARKLAAGLEFVRVDLYSIGTRIVFSEMTHYPANGMMTFQPVEYDTLFGAHWPKQR